MLDKENGYMDYSNLGSGQAFALGLSKQMERIANKEIAVLYTREMLDVMMKPSFCAYLPNVAVALRPSQHSFAPGLMVSLRSKSFGERGRYYDYMVRTVYETGNFKSIMNHVIDVARDVIGEQFVRYKTHEYWRCMDKVVKKDDQKVAPLAMVGLRQTMTTCGLLLYLAVCVLLIEFAAKFAVRIMQRKWRDRKDRGRVFKAAKRWKNRNKVAPAVNDVNRKSLRVMSITSNEEKDQEVAPTDPAN